MQVKKSLFLAGMLVFLLAGLAGFALASVYRSMGNPGIREYSKIDVNQDGIISKGELFRHKNRVIAEKHQQALKNASAGNNKNLVTVTFNRPLSIEELKELVRENNFQVKIYEARAIDHQGTRVTIGLAPQGERFLPEEFDKMLNDPNRPGEKMKFIGFIDLVGFIDVQKIKKLQSDPRVFLVDNSVDPAFVDNPKNKHMPSLYWQLEDMGLIKGEKYDFSDLPEEEILKKKMEL